MEGMTLVPTMGGQAWHEGSTYNEQKMMAEFKGWVYACVSKISDDFASINLRLYRRSGKDWTEVEDHPVFELLDAPNAGMSRFELFQLFSMHDDLTGNAYWALEGVKSERDVPTAIYPLNPRFIRPVVGKLPAFVLSYEYNDGTTKRSFKPFEILHFRRPNPDNPYIGKGPTEAGTGSIDSDNWARDWNRSFFRNAGWPSMILETDVTSEEQLKILKNSFTERYSGGQNAHKVAVLPSGVKVSHTGATQKEMDFQALRTQMRDEILAVYGVPHVALGLGAGENLNRATAEVTEEIYAKRTIKPKMRRFVTFLNEFLIPRFGEDLALDFDDPVPGNVELDIRQDQAALAGAAYMTVNEIRIKRGLEPIDGGDVLPGPAASANPLSALSAKPKAKSLPNTRYTRNAKKRADLSEALTKAAVEAMRKMGEGVAKSDWEPEWKAMVGRVTPFEKKIRDAMASYAEGMGARAVSALAAASKAVDGGDLLDTDYEVSAVIDLLGPIYQEILKKEGKAAAALIGEAFDAADERVQAAISEALGLMAGKYTEETVALLKDQVSQGVQAGDALDRLTERVQAVAEFSAKARAERVARTEAFRVANLSTREAWKQSGVVSTVKWYTAVDERVCEFCGPMHDKVTSIDGNFFDKGDTVEATDAEGKPVSLDLSYSDVGAPPLHPNCRCYIRPEDIGF